VEAELASPTLRVIVPVKIRHSGLRSASTYRSTFFWGLYAKPSSGRPPEPCTAPYASKAP